MKMMRMILFNMTKSQKKTQTKNIIQKENRGIRREESWEEYQRRIRSRLMTSSLMDILILKIAKVIKKKLNLRRKENSGNLLKNKVEKKGYHKKN